jgi:hypothetical protein
MIAFLVLLFCIFGVLVESSTVYARISVSTDAATGPFTVHRLETGQDASVATPGTGDAVASYRNDTLLSTGWSYLDIITNPTSSDDSQAYAAGFLEGSLSVQEIISYLINNQGGQLPYSQDAFFWVGTNTKYMRDQVANNPLDPFWHQVNPLSSSFFYHSLDHFPCRVHTSPSPEPEFSDTFRSFVRSFIRSFVRSFVHSFVLSLFSLLVRSFVRSFVRYLVN